MSEDTSETGVGIARPLALEVTIDGAVVTVALAADGEVIFGRSRSATVQLDHVSVSREHARLRLGAALSLEDLGSRTGTFVRGTQLEAGAVVPLGVGDTFEVGSVSLRLVPAVPGGASGDPGPSPGPGPLPGSLRVQVVELERARVEAALAAAGGNQSEAARQLGMSRGALLARLRAWGLIGRRGPTG